MQGNIYKRLASMEAIAETEKSNTIEVLQKSYEIACESLNEVDAAFFARQMRDKMLRDTDSYVALDRFGIEVPSGTSFNAWVLFLKSIGEIMTGVWAKYRQELRDLPEQEGFPFNIVFPTPPDVDKNDDELLLT